MTLKKEYKKQLRIAVLTNTVFISNQHFQFSYTPANDIVKEVYRNKYRYFGGLQSDFAEDSPEYKDLENWLCNIAENLLKTI